jgi:hypothetical protein
MLSRMPERRFGVEDCDGFVSELFGEKFEAKDDGGATVPAFPCDLAK